MQRQYFPTRRIVEGTAPFRQKEKGDRVVHIVSRYAGTTGTVLYRKGIRVRVKWDDGKESSCTESQLRWIEEDTPKC